MKRTLVLAILTLLSFCGLATHNRAGEITYSRVPPYTTVVGGAIVQAYNYTFTITKYTNDGPNVADRCQQTLYFGDGDSAIANRTNGGFSCPCSGIPCGVVTSTALDFVVKVNTYTTSHTYAGQGSYLIFCIDPMRNEGVENMTASGQQPFYIESLLMINSFTGANTSPQFKFPPTDEACLGRCFYHNPGAYDPDGDSLSFEITQSRGYGGLPVNGYYYPASPPNYGIDPVTGLLYWCSPTKINEYNLAFIVTEWRKNTSGHYQVIGHVLRDMQVIVRGCADNPPNISAIQDTCVEAGSLITKSIYVQDVDHDSVVLSGGAGAFAGPAPNAVLNNTNAPAPFTSVFTWQTGCEHIRRQPYICIFKATDQSASHLVYFGSYSIRVLPPSVKNVTAVPIGSTIKISWSLSVCNPPNNPILYYKIYRKNDCAAIVPEPCKTGVDSTLGYTSIGQSASTGTFFIDNNSGNGLVVGQDYSYLIVAVYADGSQSFASTPVCAKLKRDVPVILNVDILSTSVSSGSVFVRWTRPLTTTGNFDTIAIAGPYQFNLKYRVGAAASFSTVFTSTANSFLQLDTSYTHGNVNTVNTDQEYEVEFLANNVSIGSSQKATSVFLTATPGDRKVDLAWTATTPWNNYKYTIYRKKPGAAAFSSIATTTNTSYTDKDSVVNSNLTRSYTYCYRILSEGKYSDTTIFHPLLNNSQEVCTTAVDLTPPCVPTITITADCPVGFVQVHWENVVHSCGDDVVKYILFRKETVAADYSQLAVLSTIDSVYTFDGLALISNCFAIEAVDSAGNISPLSPDYCVDNCPEFDLPNIITANGDGVNDDFKAIHVRQIKEIDLSVFDRWGNLVYKTKDPYFKWDGVSILTNKPVSDGTFFYVCDVFEPRVMGVRKRNLHGYVQVTR